jgi:phosphoglycerate dehydrogenase-like enzyme
MFDKVRVMITFRLEQKFIEEIKAVDPRVELLYEPSLMGYPRYQSHHVGFNGTPDQEKQWENMLGQAEVIFGYISPSHSRNLKKIAPNLKWVQSPSTGIGQMVHEGGLTDSDIVFTTAGGVHTGPLAEFCMTAMLMYVKDVFRMEREQHSKHWERYCGMELRGKTLAIISLGHTGRELARLAGCFGMRVIGTKRNIEGVNLVSLGAERLYPWTDLKPMLSQADFVVLCVPHTSETTALIGEEELAAMKNGSMLINVARGVIVDQTALISALQSGHLGAAALDVTTPEPLPADSPLWDMPNVLISPHSASTVDAENEKLTNLFCENLRNYLDGKSLRNVLNKTLLY